MASGLPRASEILREQADRLAATDYEWDAGEQLSQEKIKYKIVVQADRLKTELLALADFIEKGASLGYNIQLWL